MRLSKLARFFCAGFDTVAMGGIAVTETGGQFARNLGEYVLWGSVLAAAVCAVAPTTPAGLLMAKYTPGSNAAAAIIAIMATKDSISIAP